MDDSLKMSVRSCSRLGALAFMVIGTLMVSACSWLPQSKSAKARTPDIPKPPMVYSALDWEKPRPETASPVGRTQAPANDKSADLQAAPASKISESKKTGASQPDAPAPKDPAGVLVMANQCWAQMVIKPRAIHSKQSFLAQEGRDGYNIIAQQEQTVVQPFRVKDAADSFKVQEPQFMKVTESVKVKDEVKRLVVEPAVYREQRERVMVESERVEMRACQSAGLNIASQDPRKNQQTLCAVTVPAKYKTMTKRKLVKPETVREEITPAVYKNITKMVLVENGQAIPVQIPPKFTDLSITTTTAPAQSVRTEVPATIKDVPLTTYDGAPQLTWRRVVCAKESSPSMIQRLQKSLAREGFPVGAADGKLGKRTLKAVEDYQAQKGLATGLLTHEVLEALGVYD